MSGIIHKRICPGHEWIRQLKQGDIMNRNTGFWVSFLLMVLVAVTSLASGTTLRTYTPFAGQDHAAQAYNDLMEEWGQETGNAVEDFSGEMDEVTIESLKASLAEGKVDIVVLPVGAGIDPALLVDAATLQAAAPDCGVRLMNGMREDAGIILTPVRFNWESLYVNTEVLTQHGMSIPATFEELVIDCLQLAQAGVQPIANALSEWPEVALDCAASMGAPDGSYGSQESLDGAVNVLNSLVLVGAFGSDPWNVTDQDMEEQFLGGQAAMRFDTSDLASLIPEDRAGQYAVISLPGMDGTERTALVGSPDCGLAMTRACYDDPVRREAAISFIRKLLDGRVSAVGAGTLGNSVAALTLKATDISGVLYDFNQDHFEEWSEQVIAQLMSNSVAAQ